MTNAHAGATPGGKRMHLIGLWDSPADCKAVDAGSIPTRASKLLQSRCLIRLTSVANGASRSCSSSDGSISFLARVRPVRDQCAGLRMTSTTPAATFSPVLPSILSGCSA